MKPIHWYHEADKETERRDRFIARQFPFWNMSNAKWLKLLTIMAELDPPLGFSRWKFVRDDHVYDCVGFVRSGDLWGSYVDGFHGAFVYKNIEWIEIPAQVEHKHKVISSDLDAVTTVLNHAGQFPLEMTENGLLIRGYS